MTLYQSLTKSHLVESSQYVMGEKEERVVEVGWVPQLQLLLSHVPGLIDWFHKSRTADFHNIYIIWLR